MINGRYHLHNKLGQGGMGIVHRATDRLIGETVALKQVMLPMTQIMFTSRPISQTNRELRLALAHEFQTLAGLRHPNIISVLDYGFDENRQPFFTMSYLEGAKTIVAAANGRSLPQKVNLLLQMLEALAYLHRRGILHRDLKPDNVLVVGDTVRVLDFGLAAAKEQATDSVGSWLYMAPEVLLGRPASEASDLYTVGVLAYRLLAGTHPFNMYAEDVVGEILDGEPDWSKVDASVQPAVRTLLAKKPADRYPTANQAIAAFCQALGQPVLGETAVIRESYLQAATFIGRKTEMAQLTVAMSQAKAGKGSAWLIGGESGVGKSRLLREVQTEALVAGFQVVVGQGVQGAGGVPYQLWVQPVKQLLLSAASVDDQLATVLKQIVPDEIETLLGRPIQSAPPLNDPSARQRLYLALAKLIAIQPTPVLLILEDLQWAEVSLDPLPVVLQQIETRPFLMISTYRNDEKPHLPDMLPPMNALPLSRLSPSQMEDLTIAILGEAGRQPALIEFLNRETEGNTFFAVEMLRQLAEEAGRMQNINEAILPEKLLPQTVHEIVQRRINNVPPQGHLLLQLAAVAGRELNVPLLLYLADQNLDVQNWWLLVCAETAVLEVFNNQWRFAHDKIREVILASLAEQTLVGYHGQVAQGLVHLYGDQPAYAATIAFHYRHANQPDQEREYCVAAGVYAERQYLFGEAIAFFERAYELMRPAETAVALHQNIDLINKLANRTTQHQLQRAQALAEEAYQLTQHPLLADKPYHWGQVESQIHLANALRLQSLADQALPLFLEAEAQFNQFDNPFVLAKLSTSISNVYWRLGDYSNAEVYAFQVERIAQQINDNWLLMESYIILAMVCEMLKRPEEEVAYEQKALQMARQLGDRYAEVSILNNHSVTLANRGKREEALKLALEGFHLAQELGYKTKLIHLLPNIINSYIQLKQFDQATHYLRLNEALVIEVGVTEAEIAHALQTCYLYQAQGKFAQSLAVLQQLEAKVHDYGINHWIIMLYTAFVAIYEALELPDKAAEYHKLLALATDPL